MKDEVNNAAEVIMSGGVIVYPTETVWGIGCDATNPAAVKKIFKIKQRASAKALITLIAEEQQLHDYLWEIPELTYDLLDYSTVPLTIVYPGAKKLASEVIAEDGSAAIRITSHEFCKKLIQKTGKPIVSTSANLSGQPSPSTREQIAEEVLSQADYVVNSKSFTENRSTPSRPSRIVKLGLKGEFKLIRE